MFKVKLLTAFLIGQALGGLIMLSCVRRLPKGEWECYEAKTQKYIHVSVK